MNQPLSTRHSAHFVPGQLVGTSDWHTITQEQIDLFAKATRDPDPMHIDPQWAQRGPFGGTIAFGFLTVSLLTAMAHQAMGTSSDRYDAREGYYLNYGFDRLRLIAPVPVNSRIRGHFKIKDVRPDADDRRIVVFDVTVELEGSDRPVLAADWLGCMVPPATA